MKRNPKKHLDITLLIIKGDSRIVMWLPLFSITAFPLATCHERQTRDREHACKYL